MRISDWSSDVCSSDLRRPISLAAGATADAEPPPRVAARSHARRPTDDAELAQQPGETTMKRVILPAIAGMLFACPSLAQDREASLKTVRSATRSATIAPSDRKSTRLNSSH